MNFVNAQVTLPTNTSGVQSPLYFSVGGDNSLRPALLSKRPQPLPSSLLFVRSVFATGNPYINSFSPTSATMGNTVTISGGNFLGSSSVSFGGVSATSFNVLNDSTITAVVGSGASGSVSITKGLASTSLGGFTYVFGSGNNKVLIVGSPSTASWLLDVQSKLVSTGTFAGVDTFNAQLATPTLSQLSRYGGVLVFSDASFNNATTLGNNLAAYADAGGGVVVATFCLSSTRITGNFVNNYQVMSGTSILSGSVATLGTVLFPGNATMNGVTNFNGGSSSYRGSNITLSSGSYTVANWSDGTPLVAVHDKVGPALVSRVDLNFYPPSSDARSDFWSSSSQGGKLMSNALLYVMTKSVNSPTVGSFSPTFGAFGTTVIITGTKFTGTTYVGFGGVAATSFTVLNDSTIKAVVGSGSSGNVVVVTNNGSGFLNGFTYLKSPTITSFSPSLAAIGDTILIRGSSFTGATSVSFGGVAAVGFTVINDSTISAVLGSGSSGNVSVSTTVGTASLGLLTFVTQPTITNFTPAIAVKGTVVTIAGAGFTGTTAVSFGGVPATSFTVLNDFTLSAVVGSGASGNVSVTSGLGTGISAGFTFYSGPGIPSVLVLGAPNATGELTDIRTKLLATRRFIAVDTFNAATSTPTLSTLNNYGAVFVFSNRNYNDKNAIGDLLSSFVDGGGGVVSAVYNFGQYTPLGGSFASKYLVLNPGTNLFGSASLGSVPFPSHPTVQGVTNVVLNSGGARETGTTLTSGSYVVANWNDGLPLIAVKDNVGPLFAKRVDLNFYPTNSDLATQGWVSRTQGGLVIANALSYVFKGAATSVTPSITSFAPTSGTLGTTVVISGIRFTGATYVSFGGVSSTSFTVVNDSTITAVVGSGGTGSVGIATSSGAGFLGGFTYLSAPTITSFVPSLSAKGDTILIRGSSFTGATSVSFGGVAASSFKVINDSTIQAVVGNGASGNVGVSTSIGSASLGLFTFVTQPTITSFSPTLGVSGTTVVITGAGFNGATSVSFGGVAASSFTVINDYTVSAVVGSGASGNVGITSGLGSGFLGGFTFFTGTSTSVLLLGSPGNLADFVDIKTKLLATGKFGVIDSFNAGVVTPTLGKLNNYGAVLVFSNSQYSDSVALGNVLASYVDGGGGVVSAVFNFGPFTPIGGAFASKYLVLKPGTNVTGSVTLGSVLFPGHPTIQGVTNFATNGYRESGTALTSGSYTVANWSDGLPLVAVKDNVGPLLAKRVDLNFFPASSDVETSIGWNSSTQGGLVIANALTYVFKGATTSVSPSIASFSPTFGTLGTTVTIRGIRFTGATYVSFGGVPASNFTVVNDSTITAVVGSGASGSVGVATGNGSGILGGFVYLTAPTITSFSPSLAAKGDTVLIRGSSLTSAISVIFGGVAAASYSVVNDSTIKAVLGSGSSGNVSVTTIISTASLGIFTFVTQPTITSFSPNIAAHGTTVVIKGAGFNGATAVSFGGVPAVSFTVVDGFTIAAVVGIGSSGNVSVTTGTGTGILGGFTYNYSPVISSFSPSFGCSGTTVTLTGGNFLGTTSVSFGSVASSSFVVNSDNSISAVVANGTVSGPIVITTPKGSFSSSNYFSVATSGGVDYAYIPNQGSGTVSVVNTFNNTLAATVSVGSSPYGVAVKKDGSRVYVSNYGSSNVSVINTATNTVVATVPVGSSCYSICATPDGSKIYVANYGSNSVSVINTATNSVVNTISINSPFGICSSPDGSTVYVSQYNGGAVSVINTATNLVTSTITVGSQPNGLVVSPDGSKLYVAIRGANTISVINTSSNSVSSTITVGSSPYSVAISPDGNTLYAGCSGVISIINTKNNTITGTITTISGFIIGLSMSTDGSKLFVNNTTSSNVISTLSNSIIATYTGLIGSGPVGFGNFIANVGGSPCSASIPTIEGNIANALQTPLIGATVYFNQTDSALSDSSGHYSFPVAKPGNYVIKPTLKYDANKTAGVDVVDILLVQNHILGKSVLNSPYALLAADVNGDGGIDVIDILKIKRLILGIDTVFQYSDNTNRLWAFVDSNYVFPDATNPFYPSYPDSISLTNVAASRNANSFVSIKLGDVNQDWTSSFTAAPNSFQRVAKPVELYYDTVFSTKESNTIRVRVRARQFKNLLGMQFTLGFDAGKLAYEGIENVGLPFKYNANRSGDGKLSLLWADEGNRPNSMADGSVLFDVIFVKKNSDLNGDICVNGLLTKAVAYDDQFIAHPIKKTTGAILSDQNSVVVNGEESIRIVPNPSRGQGKLVVEAKSAKEVVVNLRDARGRIIDRKRFNVVKGQNVFPVDFVGQRTVENGVYYLSATGLEGRSILPVLIEK